MYATSPTDGSNFPQFCQSAYCVVATDTVTLDGQELFFVEEAPTWPLSSGANVPTIVRSLTNAQMMSQYNIAIGGVALPTDAQPLAGHLALYSPSGAAPTVAPILQFDKWQMNRQSVGYASANKTSGFTFQFKDNQGNFLTAGPYNLTDKAWNIVQVPIYGGSRGVFVYCDTGKVPPVVW